MAYCPYGGGDLYEMAAAYLFHLVKNDLVLGVAEGRVGKAEVAVFVKGRSRKR